MKKWQIMLISTILGVALITVAGIMIYRYWVVPNYIQPMVDELGEYVQEETILDRLYIEAEKLHDDGVMEDETYSNFVRAYNEYKRDDLAYAQEILAANDTENDLDSQKNSVGTKYASYKVGIEIIKVNDDEDRNGRADVEYSDERATDRVKAEDIIKAEKIIEEEEKKQKATPTPDIVSSAYAKLRANMTADEFSTFTSIMRKLDIGELRSYLGDKEGLKAYLHSKLTNEDYSSIINLGYKYIYVFMQK